MPHQALTPVRQPQAPHPGQEGLGFRLNGLGQQPAGAAPQDGRQRLVDRLRLMQRDNGAIACHRRIAPSGGPGRLCHPPRYAALLTPPSPSFGHSSALRTSQRWWMEPQLRDTKDSRFGMGLSATRIGEPMRRDRLLLVSAFATALLTLLGAVGESLGMDRLLKSNTSKTRTH